MVLICLQYSDRLKTVCSVGLAFSDEKQTPAKCHARGQQEFLRKVTLEGVIYNSCNLCQKYGHMQVIFITHMRAAVVTPLEIGCGLCPLEKL